MKTLEERLRASCAMCGGNLSNPTIYEGDTYRYVEVRGCCYDVEFYAPPGFKLDQYPYGEPLSEWPEDFQSEVISKLNERPGTDDALAIVADAPRYTEADLIMARIGELERIKRAFLSGHNGLQAYVNSWLAGYRRDLAALSNSAQGIEQIPTNSPSEGIRATPDLPDSIHRNQGKG